MHLRRNLLNSAFALTLLTILSGPALADNTNRVTIERPGLGPGHDPNLNHFNWSRIHVSIGDTGPIVTDRRSNDISQPTVIEYQTTAQQPAPPPAMIRPSNSPAYIVEVGSGQKPADLPPSGFHSNVPIQPQHSLSLPAGASTNLLGKLYNPSQSKAASQIPMIKPTAAPVLAAARTVGPVISTYGPSPSGAGNSSAVVRTAVKAERRGTLLTHCEAR